MSTLIVHWADFFAGAGTVIVILFFIVLGAASTS